MKHHIRSKVAPEHFLGRFPSNSQIIQCLPKEIPPCANKGSLMKILSLTRKYCLLLQFFFPLRNVALVCGFES